ncbi:hypothetical protein [Tistrella mobilis]|uniref:hypothetical protein n=1 Tax=Tistrella mobilis TaxID=171437 RepID=UPI003558AB23
MSRVRKQPGERPVAPRCALGRIQSARPDVETVKRRGWREDGILVISGADKRLDWAEREVIRQIGERLYGPGPGSAADPTSAGASGPAGSVVRE